MNVNVLTQIYNISFSFTFRFFSSAIAPLLTLFLSLFTFSSLAFICLKPTLKTKKKILFCCDIGKIHGNIVDIRVDCTVDVTIFVEYVAIFCVALN